MTRDGGRFPNTNVVLNIAGWHTIADLVVFGMTAFPDGLIIESRWQEQGGSTDEKLCFLITNVVESYDLPTIVVVDGGGARHGMIAWAKRQVGHGNLLHVFTIAEFLKWTNNQDR